MLEFPTGAVKQNVGPSNACVRGLCQHRRMRGKTLLSDRVRGLREDRAPLTVEVAADAIGISRSYLSGIETGADNPGRETLIAIANYYKVSVDWLASGQGDPRPNALEERTARLVEVFEALPPDQKTIVEDLAASLSRLPRDR